MASEQFGLRVMAAFNPVQLELLQEMKELLNSATKRLDRMMLGMNQQHETMIKNIDSVLAPVTRTDLVEDEEIEALLSDDGEVTEGSKPDLISTDDFHVEFPSSILAEEVVSETRVFGTAKNHQLGAVPNHGQIVDRISKILMERGAATSPLLASTKKKKKKKKTSFVKDRGKTPTLQRRGRRPRKINGKVRQKAYQSPSQVRSSASASASEKKTKAAATFVKDPRVPTSLSSASAKKKKRKKKKKEKETKFVKDRGKSTTGKRWRTQWHIDGGA